MPAIQVKLQPHLSLTWWRKVVKKKKLSPTQDHMDLISQLFQNALAWMLLIHLERPNVDKLVDIPKPETGSSNCKKTKKKRRTQHQTIKNLPLVPQNFQSAQAWTVTERAWIAQLMEPLTADKSVDSMVHGQSLTMSNLNKLVSSNTPHNFQPAINGSPPTANQSAPEISPPAALRKEPQSHQRETDSRANGLTSQARPPSSQESPQETESPTTTSTERQDWELSNERENNNLFD